MDGFRLMIGTCYYEVKAYAPQIPCLVDAFRVLNELGIDYTYLQICGDSYVDRAKNSLVHEFLKSDYTHLMIIDSDETWDVIGFARLIKSALKGFEVIGGLYPCKNNWEFFGGIPNAKDGQILGREEAGCRVIDMYCVPGGFIIYTREAIERTRPNLDSYLAPETNEYILEVFRCNIETNTPRYTAEELEKLDKAELVQLYLSNQRGNRRGGRVGEDIYFQQRYKEMGGKIWCEPDINMGHIGIKEWQGNYNQHLLECRGVAEAPAA